MIGRSVLSTGFFLAGLLLAFGFLTTQETRAADDPPIGIKEGQMYPDFHLPTIDGQLARLSDYRGKKILLFHFASW